MSHPDSAASRPDPGSGENVAGLFRWEDLERLRAAADTILELADDDAIPAPLESELTSFRERLERAFLYLGPDRLPQRHDGIAADIPTIGRSTSIAFGCHRAPSRTRGA
jgi:hypothetical protein